jgi:hypothetical protein
VVTAWAAVNGVVAGAGVHVVAPLKSADRVVPALGENLVRTRRTGQNVVPVRAADDHVPAMCERRADQRQAEESDQTESDESR